MIFYQSENAGSAVGTPIVGGDTQILTAIIEFVLSFGFGGSGHTK